MKRMSLMQLNSPFIRHSHFINNTKVNFFFTKLKSHDLKDEDISKAEDLINQSKYLEALLYMEKLPVRNEKILQMIANTRKKFQDELLLNRYEYYKKFISFHEHNSRLFSNSLITMLLFCLSFGLYFGFNFYSKKNKIFLL
jgi:hypothetical protein